MMLRINKHLRMALRVNGRNASAAVTTHRARRAGLLSLAVAAVFVVAGRADASVVYSYSGNRFPFVEAGNQGNARVTGTATFGSVPQMPGVHLAEDYSLTVHREGLPTITISANQDNIEFKVGYFLFNMDGNIVRWGVQLVEDHSMGDFPREIYTGNAPLDSDAVGDGYFLGPLRGEGYNENDQGAWQVAPIPLPGALLLLLSSILLLSCTSLGSRPIDWVEADLVA